MTGYFRAYSNRVREASRDLPERELRVYLVLLSYANCEATCWPGIKCLVDTTGLHTEAVLTALDALTAKKYIIVLRKGTRDALTHSMLPNVWKIEGAVIDDDCSDDEFRTDDPILNSREELESQHHHRTDSINTTKETQPKTPPPTQPTPSKMEVRKTNTTPKTKTEKTPGRSPNTNSPDSVPRKFYSGPLAEFAGPLAADDEQIVADLRAIDARMTIRTARYLVASRGAARALWAIGHYRKQSNVFNPAGYIRSLIEREAVEQVDAEPIDPGLAYITGAYADYIDH